MGALWPGVACGSARSLLYCAAVRSPGLVAARSPCTVVPLPGEFAGRPADML